MSNLTPVTFTEIDLDAIAAHEGRVAVFVDAAGKLDQCARRVNRLTKGAIARLAETSRWEKMAEGDIVSLAYPAGMAAEAVDVIRLERASKTAQARKAGAALAKARGGKGDVLMLCGLIRRAEEVVYGFVMRDYAFEDHKSADTTRGGSAKVMHSKPSELEAACAPLLAVAEGAHMCRDLTNEPANVLTTTNYAERLKEMESLGLKVEVLDEKALEKLGMRTLLSVGQGSVSPSYVVAMQWNGGEKGAAPLALVGKGVVFDTGGISLKPGAGMEEMTMDMGGSAVVAGVMRTLALRGAKANVVGLVGIVENMPSGNASRPGDVVTTMKGLTVENINTDAEGRLVLCDVMHYAQEKYKPAAMIDLATLTGAIIIGLGHENAGVFSNNTSFCNDFLKAAEAEGEGAWRMPMGDGYDKQLKSRIADMKNVGGRPAGSITAAQFLGRFVQEDCPWIHLDIAGVASVKSETALAPVGATGWGVASLNRLVADNYEAE
ncbi:leucyl aminopeptidase [Sulfitobacter donghicola]|uniref:Probable cytosol aminopeptidase n=1 Tax=Sulfitobacter donghicola DSW-25 = KCTC 12864 = JCM 14565 TaxID=1300350 RepID=A0A073IJ51_9RHOB|nr:leucyl aminopeptidase [Sulfitobacter donghicola]KEJ89595.1 aminopeptidase A [Sulfitobacter donghicola DSW-25 = KCTC 12864 = JCM 14565]KIN69432.1 putative cytosol aminopeptidase [Sulfitobacter donghicola DSW-25 = KCTC 12864 = JCM 14565]